VKKVYALLFFIAVFITLPTAAFADQRPYVFTYPYRQAYPGEWEIELYNDWNLDADARGAARYQVEIEHGITEDYMMGLYADFRDQGAGRGLELKQWKLVNRFHLAPYGKLPLDPALYLEYKKSTESASRDAIEGKLILAKDFGKDSRWSFAANLIWNRQLDGRSNAAFEYAAGLAYEHHRNTYYFMELKANPAGDEYYLVPGFSVPVGKRNNPRLNLGLGKGLNNRSKDFIVRAIFSYEF
jgi:hypothetical protein